MNNNIQCSIESSTTKIEFNSAVDGVFLVPELEGLAGLPEIRTTSGVNAGYDGGWTSAQNYDARLISIRGVIANPDVAQVEAKRRAIASLLGQGRKEQLTLRFTTEAGNSYVIYVRTISCEMALQRVLTTQEFLIQLRADDPLIYDDGASGGTEAILQVQKALGGFEINFELPLAIGGGAEDTIVENGAETAYPLIKLYGSLHSPTVVNRTTNQQMQILADLQYTISWSGYTTKSGSFITLNDAIQNAPMSLTQIKGNAEQNGTPTPDAPVPVDVVTGEQVVKIDGSDDSQEFEVNLGKNLIYQTQLPKTQADVTATYQDGVFELSGTASANSNLYILPYTQSIVHLEAGESLTYYLERVGGTSKVYFVTYFIPDDGSATDYNWQLTMEASENSKKLVKTATKAGKVAYVQFFLNNGVEYDVQVKVLVQKGNIANPSWAEYFTPLELAKVGTYQDRIYKDEGKWYVEKQVGKVVFDGTENWATPGTYYCSLAKTDTKISMLNLPSSTMRMICDHFTCGGGAYGKDLIGYFGAGGSYLNFNYDNTNNTTTFKTWLTSNPTTVYAPLTTPTTTEITDSTLIEQLEHIYQLYGGLNNISIVGAGNGSIEISYATEDTITQDVVTIDSQARTITLNGQDIYHLKSEESEFLLLAPGDNKLYLTSEVSDDSGYAEVKFKQGYLSI